MTYKTCNNCSQTLPITNFHKAGKGKFYSFCKVCRKVRRKVTDSKPLRRYNKCKGDAKRRGIEFSLTKEYFFSFEDLSCHYCGLTVYPISLDRVDNDIGYIVGNVVSCCYVCNSLKHVFEANSFIKHVEKIYTYQNRNENNDQQEDVSEEALGENSLEPKGI